MKNALRALLKGQPHDYYCIVSQVPAESSVLLPETITDRTDLFISNPPHIYSSEKLALASCKEREEPFRLDCLECFLTTVRPKINLKYIMLDDTFQCELVAWRAPCQTTALLRDQGQVYYMEGCKDSGIYWKAISEKPETPPPFIACGASNMDCLWLDCPNYSEFMDDIPVTLCTTTEKIDLRDFHGTCIIRFNVPGFGPLFYAGISEEGFDFANSESHAIQLNGATAKRVATAIANVQINWSSGMMANKPGCSVVVTDEQGNELVSIQ